MDKLTTQEQLILTHKLEFFKKETNIKTFIDIVVTKKIPLRLIESFVTHYAKENNMSYIIKCNDSLKNFSIYNEYRSQLKSYKKKLFDPYCRGKTISLEYISTFDNKKYIIQTAICQINFFKWAIENLLIDYIENNINIIKENMKYK